MDRNALDQLQNSTVFATDGDKIGSVGQVYLDDVTNEPTFVTVKTGLFGARETFVPLQQAQTTADGITVPFEKSFVKDAPNVDADGSLTPEEEQRIYEYYSMEYSAADYDGDVRRDDVRTDAGAAGVAGTAGVAGVADRRDEAVVDGDRHDVTDRDRRDVADHDRRDVTDADSVVVKDEHLNVGTERRASGRVRLRKQAYTTTETVEVPVTREEVVVERESVDPNSAEARTAGRDGDVEVTTYEETPVVNKTVDAEKVSLGKRQVQDTETVTEEVRHEDVKVDGDATDRDLDGRNDRKDRI
ncbi:MULTISPECIES: PRC and DUF2382 domain-containing protein [Micrococcus]|uniref:PRC and DUF2382 domain-containing protein n=1 Tax=Micrococcus TaxID=1269 RepID=UPI0001C4FF74|nr:MULTISPECIES: PRC and DUF2382 domain-containing protein [Micrococcus]PFH06577.1 uncharacterized protein (TIGR02271 family) [Micrococcaceae bacterium JKS001869]EFD49764.1 hypothetical protein HMPREF0569_1666 [Micrococcus luteus SK58]KWW35226.1 Stress response protein YsnF [Micrococcus luteus]MBN6768046.1 PRC and DUF2382 domain-containing protein [Micrococcus luteus]MBN6828418.1 PRC and DUF2382 domain-containing protein [Micrococcus luteus]